MHIAVALEISPKQTSKTNEYCVAASPKVAAQRAPKQVRVTSVAMLPLRTFGWENGAMLRTAQAGALVFMSPDLQGAEANHRKLF